MLSILEKINKASIRFLEPLNPEETYSSIVKEAIKLVGADHGSIFTYFNKKLIRVFATSEVLYSYVPRRKGYLFKAIQKKKPSIIKAEKVAKIHPQLKKLGTNSITHIPILYRKKPIGILSLYSKKNNYFSTKELDILDLFGSMASLAIRKMQLYTETKSALELRDQFIFLASHELRTPLTSITGYAQMLYRKSKDFNPPESNWIKNLYPETVRLTSLIKELLDVNQIKTGQLIYVFKECSLREVINRSFKNMGFNYPNRKIIFKDETNNTSDIVIGDHDKLLQVIDNALDNALKFTPKGKLVKLTLSSSRSDLIITLQDQGIGISKENLPNIFKSFYREAVNTTEGIGLGLFLTKNIIESHKGTVKISSKKGIGTKVEIKLPKVITI